MESGNNVSVPFVRNMENEQRPTILIQPSVKMHSSIEILIDHYGHMHNAQNWETYCMQI